LSNLKVLHIFILQKDKCSKFADLFCDEKWLSVVCYLEYIFEKTNKICPFKVKETFSELVTLKKAFFKRNSWYRESTSTMDVWRTFL